MELLPEGPAALRELRNLQELQELIGLREKTEAMLAQARIELSENDCFGATLGEIDCLIELRLLDEHT